MSNSPVTNGTLCPMSPGGTRISQIVKVPVDQEVHLVERHVEFPEIHVRKIIQPKVQLQEIIKEVVVPEPYWEDVFVEVPEVRVVESVVYIPEVKQVVIQVPRVEVHEVIKEVPKVEIQYEDEYVQVPRRVPVDKLVEVEEIEEIIKVVPKITYVDKEVEKIVYVPKVEIEYVEEVREVPGEKKIVQVAPKDAAKKKVIKEVPGPIQYVEKIVEKHVPGPIEYVERINKIEIPGPIIDVPKNSGGNSVVRDRVFQVPREEVIEKIVEVPVKKEVPTQAVKQEIRNVPGNIEYVDEKGNLLPIDSNGNPILLIEDKMLQAAGLYQGPNEYVPVPMAMYNSQMVAPINYKPVYNKPFTPLQLSSQLQTPIPVASSFNPNNNVTPLPQPVSLSQQFAATEKVLSPTNMDLQSPLSAYNYNSDPSVVIIEPIKGEIFVKQLQPIITQAPPVYIYEESGRILPEIVETLPPQIIRVPPPPTYNPVILTAATKQEDGTLAPFQPIFEQGPPPANAIPLPFGAPLPAGAKYFLGPRIDMTESQIHVQEQFIPVPNYFTNFGHFGFQNAFPVFNQSLVHSQVQ